MLENNNRRNIITALIVIIGSAFLVRLTIGVIYFNAFDTYWYRNWAWDLPNGFFSVYSRAEAISLDYPPLYLFCLYFTGLAYRFFGFACADGLQMFLMKFWPILFDTLAALVIYFAARKKSELFALFAAAFWAMNPSALFNSSFWGQTDGLMIMLLVLAFMKADDRPVLSCFLFAVAGLTKYQSLFFAPALLAYIFRRRGLSSLLKGIGAAALTVIGVFMPFMFGAANPLLIFDVYLGGANTYQYCTFNAYNIYGLLGLNCTYDQSRVLGSITYSHINTALLILIVAATVYLVLKAKRSNIYVAGLFIMQCIFMLSTRMHERYQMVVLPFALLAFVTTKERRFMWQFGWLTVLTLINQFVVLANVNHNMFAASQNGVMSVVSAANVLVFIHTVYTCINYFLKEESHELFERTSSNLETAEK